MRLRYYASAKNWAEVIRIWRELNTENKQFSLISSVDDTVTEKRVLAASLLREVAQAYRFGSADKERARQELQTLFDYAAKHKLLTYLSTRLVSLLFFALDNSREGMDNYLAVKEVTLLIQFVQPRCSLGRASYSSKAKVWPPCAIAGLQRRSYRISDRRRPHHLTCERPTSNYASNSNLCSTKVIHQSP